MKSTPLVLIPTYNERENVVALCEAILALGIPLDIAFLDDNSPDGTGEILDELSGKYSNVTVIHRSGKQGIGSAHIAGFRWAHEHGYQTLITMDADFTHSPEHIRDCLQLASQYDVVLGSRYRKSNSLPGWNAMRKSLTYTGHLLTRFLLGMPYDATGALRLYRLDRIPAFAFDVVHSRGYSFFFESLYVLHQNGFRIGEFPIALPARTYGNSKMVFGEVLKSVKLLVSTFLRARLEPEKFRIVAPLPATAIDATKADPQGWDDYWNTQAQGGRILYDAVAALYRKLLIRPVLRHFIKRHFSAGMKLLHAGCGGGQVDRPIRKYVAITGLDISLNALRIYRQTNGECCSVLHGSIFEMPLPDASFDGVYNLGVMEHFTEQEIQTILKEFQRVLRPGGKVVLLWPPEFGISVLFFKGLKAIFSVFLRKPDVKFHPDEITRLRSEAQARDIIEQSGLSWLEYYFGPRDMFTHCVIVAQKP